MLVGYVLDAFDRRVGRYEPIDIFHAGIGCGQDSHRRALDKRAHRAGRADPYPDIGAAGDHRLQRLTGALSAEIFQNDAVLLKDSSPHTKRRHLVSPGINLTDCDLDCVLCAGRCDEVRQQNKSRQEARRRRKSISFHWSVSGDVVRLYQIALAAAPIAPLWRPAATILQVKRISLQYAVVPQLGSTSALIN